MTKKAKEFMKENAIHPVVSGSIVGSGGQGGFYTLANHKTFRLSREDCLALDPEYPIWLDMMVDKSY